uniref:SXP/RAL-2 family protein Ani s 5-like cation-binding domain-containing protein n=1 Tax=Panagrolaimus sp. ES5 TaxID=591445 RepID=A0AC34F7P6_9BILA
MWKNIMFPIFFCFILFLSTINGAEEKKVKPKEPAATQHPMAEIFSTNNGTNIEEKEASQLSPITTVHPTTILATTLLPIQAVETEAPKVSKPKNTTPKNVNQANVDVIIQAPVAKPGEPLLDGIFVAPDKDSLSIAIGGAEIALDITKTTNNTNTSQPLNGEKIPEALKGTIPTFLLHASDAARRSFFEIENNGNIPKTQYIQAVTIWAQQQSPEVLTSFNEYVNNLKATKQAAQQVLTEKAKSLSQAAQRANNQIQQIQNDDNLTKSQEQSQINEIFNNLPKKTQKELTDLTTNSTA